MNNKILLVKLNLLIILWFSLPVMAHEFWLEPKNFTLNIGDKLQVDIKNGQYFKGNSLPFLKSNFLTFKIIAGDVVTEVKSRLGDMPAVNQDTKNNGLHILNYVSTYDTLIYKKETKFKSFLNREGLQWVLTEHKKRNLPKTGFKEIYRRFSKTLVKVGKGKGQDKSTGMLFELIALNNPYTEKGDVKFQLLYKNKPFPNSQINIFYRENNDAKAKTSSLNTDKNGEVVIPREKKGVYLINSVQMLARDPKEKSSQGAVWESLWASSVFEG